MKFVALICSALVVSACAPKSDLESANKKVAELQAQVAALRAVNDELKAAKAQLTAQLSKKPELPVSFSLRKALLGPGLVAVFNTTVKSPVSALATIKSAALGTTKRFELHLSPAAPSELGHLQGAVIETGDTITLENNNYSPITFTVNAP